MPAMSAAAPALDQRIGQCERMLEAVAHLGDAFAGQALELTRRGAGDDGIALLRLPTLEHAGALEHETARPAAEPPGDALEPDERGRAVVSIHHQVLDQAL